MITVDIDTGGTMTDALITDGTTRHSIKVDTTPHDFTVSFQACLQEAAKLYDYETIEEFLRNVALIRWSSTITTNVLAERRGAKIGLLVSKGHEEDLYGGERSVVVDELISPENVIGLSDNPSPEEVLMAVKALLETGARRICVALKGTFPDNEAEKRIKDIIEEQYPDHIIGSVPVLLGSEMAQLGHDQTRAHASLMNAYTHTRLASSLFKAEDILRDEHRWPGALLIGHTSGGVARVGKTKAVDTIESGPVFGTFGGAYLAREYGLDHVACFDVGGTTTKASVVKDGEPVFQRGGDLMEIPVKTAFALLRSAAIGGGSVARVRGGKVALGPDSMGAAPGPACYGLGGNMATITDALLLLGYLDADRFLGGRRRLDIEKATAAIERNVAQPLGVTAAQAALLIRNEAVAVMAELVSDTLGEASVPVAGTTLFAFGGNGPMFGCFVADKLGLDRVYAFDLGPVFSAFGSAQSDVAHVYERGIGKPWGDTLILQMACDVYAQAVRDLEGEGFDPSKAEYRWELEFGAHEAITHTARFAFSGEPDMAWVKAGAEAVGEGAGDAPLILLRLASRYVVGAQGLAARPRKAGAKAPATREIRFNGSGETLPAYIWEDLNVGDVIKGPAMVNGSTMTCPVPPGWTLEVDPHGNAKLQKSK